MFFAWLFILGPLSRLDGNEAPSLPFSYTVAPEDIVRVDISTGQSGQSWIYRDDINEWVFESTPWVTVNTARWGGIPLLLSGPRQARILEEIVVGPSNYGLDEPEIFISLTLRDMSEYLISLGDKTVGGGHNYAMVSGADRIFLVDTTWGDILNRLVDEPPYPTWFYNFDPLNVREIILFEGDEVVRAFGRNPDSAEWRICSLPVESDPCVGNQPANTQAILENLTHIANHQIIGLADMDLVATEQFAAFGTTRNSPYVRIRVEMLNDNGIVEVTGVTLNLGAVTPDGSGRYAVMNETSDIVIIDVDWAETILENLFKNDSLVSAP